MSLIADFVAAGYPLLSIRTQEQERAYETILEELGAGHLRDLNLFVWKANTGLVRKDRAAPFAPPIDRDKVAEDVLSSLKYTTQGENRNNKPSGAPENSIYVFFNLRPFLASQRSNPNPAGFQIVQQIRDAAVVLRGIGSHIVMIGGAFDLPEELNDIVTVVDFDLPTKADIGKMFKRVIASNAEEVEGEVSEDLLELAAESTVGLPLLKAENALALSIAKTGGVNLKILRAEKEQIIKGSSSIEWIRDVESVSALGGFDLLKPYILKRRGYFKDRKRAEQFGVRPPKGILLVGVPGTGKTLSAKCIAGELGLDLYAFKIASVFSRFQGASHENLISHLKVIEALAPCVLLLDELEKAMAGLESSGQTDGGTTSRVLGSFMSWMSDCKAPIYKVGTANTIRNLDAAIFRRGRWDAVFGVDLPQATEREQIFSIHLKKRGRNPEDFDLTKLAYAAKHLVGAEIESIVDDALYNAFYDSVDMTIDHLLAACRDIKPISLTDKEGIDAFRIWIKERAMPVSSIRVEPMGSIRTSTEPPKDRKTQKAGVRNLEN